MSPAASPNPITKIRTNVGPVKVLDGESGIRHYVAKMSNFYLLNCIARDQEI